MTGGAGRSYALTNGSAVEPEPEPSIRDQVEAAVTRSPAVAGLAAGGAFVLAIATLLDYGLDVNGVLWAAAQVLLVFIGWFDTNTRRIPNVVVVPAAAIAVLVRLAFETGAVLECLAAGAIAFGLFFVLALVARGGLGMGDVKLVGLLGLLLGQEALYAVMLGVIAGGIAAGLIIASRRGSRKTSYAYGPYLAFGAVVTILFAQPPHLV